MQWLYIYLTWLVLAGLTTFILYGVDKNRAKKKAWRIPEATLHWMSVAGGFIGGWIGRSAFRHKTQKPFFVFVLVFATILHMALIYWFFIR